MTKPTYWLPEWWDLPTPGHKWHRIINEDHSQGRGGQLVGYKHQTINIELPSPPDFGGFPPGPPPAAAGAVQVTDEGLRAIKRKRRQSREKRLRR